jgi:hypothetical protein
MTGEGRVRTFRLVNRSAAVEQLPTMHAVAIRLRDEGVGDHVIAVALAIDDDEVPNVLRIAAAKLANVMALEPSIKENMS